MTMKLRVLCSAIALSTLIGGAIAAPAPGNSDADQRARLGNEVVQKWSAHVASTYKMNPKTWAKEMAPAFSEATMEELVAAASATDFSSVNKLLLGQQALPKGGGSGTLDFGDADAELVFVPVTPCRIIDTRLAGGQLAANTARGFDVTVIPTNYAFQGGDATDCGGAGTVGSYAAAVINFVAVRPGAEGFLTAYPFNAPQPTSSTLNYTTNSIVANNAIVRLDQGASTNELNVFSSAPTHVVADLVGYFINPVLKPIDCQEVESTGITIAANGTGVGSSPVCAAGYTIMGGSCSSTSFNGRVVTTRTQPNLNSHFCAFANEGASSMTGVAYAQCCKLPSGR